MSSSAVSVNALVFSGGEVWSEDEPDVQANAILQTLAQSVTLAGPSSAGTNETRQSVADRNVSTYVRVFEDMVGTVIGEEKHLLNDEEFALLTVFAHLSYNARFLMVKLLLRKQDTWHRLDALKYESELGSTEAIVAAIDELCQIGPEPLDLIKQEEQRQEVVDLTMDESSSEDKPIALAKCEREMDLKSLLECLRVDELKDVAKQLKRKPKQKKDDLIKDLLNASSSQSTLTSYASRDSKGRSYHQAKLPFCKLKPQKDRLKEIVLRHIVRCVRVDEEFFGVIHRVNLVYFRITQHTPGILVAALLTRFGKRAYPGYEYERTKNVWPSRQALLDYEEVLVLEGQVDTLLSGNVPPWGGRAAGNKTPVARFLSTSITPGNANDSREGQDIENEDTMSDVKPDNDRKRGARMVKDIFERIYPRWQDLVMSEGEEDGRAGGLERFHYGHVITRIICKGSAALGILGEHERELEVLEALLAQKRWRRGQRGRWYERRALILSTHFPDDEETMERALDAVMEALVDTDTHIVFRPKLQRRLRRLENKLKIPVKERHTCDGVLVNADEVVFEAVRLRHRAASLKLDRTGRCINPSEQGNQDIKRYYSPAATLVKPETDSSATPASGRKSPSDASKGKSLWLGRDGEELTVEELALQRYKEQGFKGVHCETRVITMLFGLLFWDIIFESIPGAFETPYQTAPLDIAEDSFFHARKDLMEQRLAAIEAGKGADLIRRVDTEHRASGTWCVGVRWDLFSSEDLVDIVTCLGGKVLSVICRVLCEHYTFGTSGGPDLFLWNTEKGTCKFVEVKGPGDSLQENQRIWIDILLKAPVAVEICRVVECGDEIDKKPNARTPKSTRKKTKNTVRKQERMSVESEDADALPNILDGPHATLESQIAATGIRTSPGPSTSIKGMSSPLKRKASPPGVVPPTPSKRQRT
ncbi:VRR-NUC domain-containing protein [Boletus edulis BED1]|uniref:Fanconi-associated nuclease n=1 Tax=Boletus edulis BED1 TaxID=1328754 RepID=A0AAD4C343_BOLED|nr:VRR-NUC domain-containing protein [Boletus edulis BED1]